jgi:hypothetical protein
MQKSFEKRLEEQEKHFDKLVINETINKEKVKHECMVKENMLREQITKLEEKNKELQEKLNHYIYGQNPSNNVNIFNVQTEEKTPIIEEKGSTGIPVDLKLNEKPLILNNIIIPTRYIDNYVNLTEMCKSANKKFNDWKRLDKTDEFLKELSRSTGIPVDLLIQTILRGPNELRGTWGHPRVSINVAQWISPAFDVEVSKHILELYTTGSTEIKNFELVKTIEDKTKRIKCLEKRYAKRQAREDYKEKNVIYIVATKHQIENRTCKIGKAKNFKERLSTYNTSEEHEVIYIRECNDEDHMNIVELAVFYDLKEYREQANRERFILPENKTIDYFISVIDECISKI